MKTRQLGAIAIARIVEREEPAFTVSGLLPDATPETLAPHRPWLEPKALDPATGLLILPIQSYVVRTRRHNILIDGCLGEDKTCRWQMRWHKMRELRFLSDLAAVGLAPEDIDFVMCTHLHGDHVGWNTRLENGRWVPTFPKAKYLFADRELTHWTAKEQDDQANHPWITDSVLPIIAAGRAEVVKSDHRLNELVQFIPTPGHTIDHFSVHVGKPGQDAVITGDMIHSPIQARYPELGMRADYDSKQAGRSRRTVFERFCDSPTLMCMAHFPSPSVGRISRWGEGFKFVSA